jgi:hypothetical protein
LLLAAVCCVCVLCAGRGSLEGTRTFQSHALYIPLNGSKNYYCLLTNVSQTSHQRTNIGVNLPRHCRFKISPTFKNKTPKGTFQKTHPTHTIISHLSPPSTNIFTHHPTQYRIHCIKYTYHSTL